MKLLITFALLSGLSLADEYFNRNAAEGPIYYRGQCQNNIATVGSLLVATAYDEAKTESACTQLGGKICDFGCVITGDKNTPDLTHAS